MTSSQTTHNLGVDYTTWEWTTQPGSGQHNLGVANAVWLVIRWEEVMTKVVTEHNLGVAKVALRLVQC